MRRVGRRKLHPLARKVRDETNRLKESKRDYQDKIPGDDGMTASARLMSGLGDALEEAMGALDEEEVRTVAHAIVLCEPMEQFLFNIRLEESKAMVVLRRALLKLGARLDQSKVKASVPRVFLGHIGKLCVEELRAESLYWSPPRKKYFYFRSQWEVDFADLLDRLGVQWEYEPKTFLLAEGKKYTPDFFVNSPLGDCFVELHVMRTESTWFGTSAEKRLRAVDEMVALSGYPLVILDEFEVARMKRFLASLKK